MIYKLYDQSCNSRLRVEGPNFEIVIVNARPTGTRSVELRYKETIYNYHYLNGRPHNTPNLIDHTHIVYLITLWYTNHLQSTRIIGNCMDIVSPIVMNKISIPLTGSNTLIHHLLVPELTSGHTEVSDGKFRQKMTPYFQTRK